jgi:transcriptional regulator with XRE-family HTH domain
LSVTSSLGLELRERRKAAGLTQGAAADRLGVARATLTQWEGDRHRPKPEHLSKLDDLYGARGELIKLAESGRRDDGAPEPGGRLFLADVFRNVADALVDALVVVDGRPRGWSRNLTDRRPTPLSTAFVVRTLQLLDEARVDLHALAEFFEDSASPAGWSYSSGGRSRPRPEVTAVLHAARSRLGRLTDVEDALSQLEAGLDRFALSRPYAVAVVLESVLAMRPDAALAGQLVRHLLDARKPYADRLLWTMDASAAPELMVPSQAHTARATAVLRLARSSGDYPGVDDAIDMAVDWMTSLQKGDDSLIEVLPSTTEDRAPGIPIHHFTAAWTIRAIAGIEGVPATRLQSALDVLWDSYSPAASLWVWRDDGTLPSWMTLDAVSALRLMAEVSFATPILASPHSGDPI